jgi:hypothetical protein
LGYFINLPTALCSTRTASSSPAFAAVWIGKVYCTFRNPVERLSCTLVAMRSFLPVFCLVCATSCRGSAVPSADYEPQWLVLRVDTVQVSPYHPGTTGTWDNPAPQSNDGAECGLIGVAGSFLFSPIAGKGAEYLCTLGSRPRRQEQDPSAPDLVVELSAGATTNYPTYTARDTFQHVFRSEFVVPTEAIPPEGLLLTVSDRDGNQREVIGALRLQRAQLLHALQTNPLLTLSDPTGSLQRLELIVAAHTNDAESFTIPMNVQDGTIDSRFRPVRAGEIIAISASGQYKVGNLFYDKWIDPRGYPNNEARGYNFDNEPFKSAPHGGGLAIIGTGDGKTGHNVAPCARFISRGSGPLILGLNDSEPKNNQGTAQFTVRVSPPRVTEWLEAQTGSCQAQ